MQTGNGIQAVPGLPDRWGQSKISDEILTPTPLASRLRGTNRQDSRFARRQPPAGLRPRKDAMSDGRGATDDRDRQDGQAIPWPAPGRDPRRGALPPAGLSGQH